jgi:ATP adenylyltransferase
MQQMWTPWRMAYIRREPRPGCIFCEMLDTEDDRAQLILHRGKLAFLVLNKYPYNNGHLMAVPYRHMDTVEALTPEETVDMMSLVSLGIRALRLTSKPEGFNIGVNLGKIAGAGVLDHVHIHIVPRWGGDTNFMPVLADVRLIPQDLNETYDELKGALATLLQA